MKALLAKFTLCMVALLSPLGAEAVDGFSGPTWYDYRDTSLDTERCGTLDNPIVIKTPGQLAQLSYLVNERDMGFRSKVFVLGADINLNKTDNGQRVQWIPIGYKPYNTFEGIFIGADIKQMNAEGSWQPKHSHTISGLYIDHWLSDDDDIALGLFGYSRGFLGYLSIKDAIIKSHAGRSGWRQIGLLCGSPSLGSGSTVADGSTAVNISHTICHVSVEGTVTTAAEGNKAKIYVGGIAGMVTGDQFGIAHCQSKLVIDSSQCSFAGGIVGDLSSDVSILDCAADANISVKIHNQDRVGGIVGRMGSNCKTEGCASSGRLYGSIVGGICGEFNSNSTVKEGIIACTSTATVSGVSYIGGILGYMQDRYRLGQIKYCAFGGHVDATDAPYAGGLCGAIAPTSGEHLSHSLMLGTIHPMTKDGAHIGLIAGESGKPVEVIANCYYDGQMCHGNVTSSEATHLTVKALNTPELTGGDKDCFPLLEVSESAPVGFSVRDGFYPIVYTKTEWPVYQNFPAVDKHASPATRLLFDRNTIDKSNTVYQAGAFICAIPSGIRRGDSAWDFVSTVSLAGKALEYEESGTGRVIKVNTESQIPVSEALQVKEKTATALSNGSALLTITAKVSTPDANLYHPNPVGGSKQLMLNITAGQTWDGTTADACAYGTGDAEDPYIIKNGAQLAYAVLNNHAGQHYEQICDITLNSQVYKSGISVMSNLHKWIDGHFDAHYDGGGHYIIGPLMANENMGLFGKVGRTAEIENLAVVDANFQRHSGVFASTMDGYIHNCIAQGFSFRPAGDRTDEHSDKSYSGGFCSTIGTGNPNALIEDCISGVFHTRILSDFSPFVSLTDENKGKVSNCLSVVSVISDDLNFTGQLISMANRSYIQDCYWLKGYEQANTGYTLEEICSTLGSRKMWTFEPNYFPTLKTFAASDMAKLMSVPFRTDIDYVFDEKRKTSDNFLMGFSRQLSYEPASVDWKTDDTSDTTIEWDSEMGILVPISSNGFPGKDNNLPYVRTLPWLEVFEGKLGKFTHHIVVRTDKAAVNRGISFVDNNARAACLAAFDSDDDGNLSLAELKAVTNEQIQNAFQTPTAQQIENFPEFRYFKNVTTLSSQLAGLDKLKSLRLPYALQTLGTEAFKGCTSLKEVTIPAKMTTVEPGAFHLSSVENILTDPFNAVFESREGVLFTKDANAVTDDKTVLAAFPNGRSEVVIPGLVTRIAEGAVYKVPGAHDLYFDTTDFSTVPHLDSGGLVSDDGQLMNVYVCDATNDSVLLRAYRREATWSAYVKANRLSRYYPLKIGTDVTATDSEGRQCYVGTFYIGFDTQLPDNMTPYIVSLADEENFTAYLREAVRQVPRTSPVVVLATEPGLYRLHPLSWQLEEWPMWANKLIGTDRLGMPIYQQHSAQGSILTPQNTTAGFGFYYDKQTELPPYHAYITYNTVGKDEATARQAHYASVYDFQTVDKQFALGDYTYKIIHVQSNDDYLATLTSYSGAGGNIVVPPTISWGGQTQVPITKLGPAAFRGGKGDIYSIDMSGLEEMEAVSTNRTASEAPFYGVDERTIIYLPEGKATAADNVVIGPLCKKLILTDGWSFVPPYEFNAEEVNYDRVLSAKQNDDGTWQSVTYTMCLPYRIYFPNIVGNYEDLVVYRAYALKDGQELGFHPSSMVVEAGQPSLIEVKKGSVSLNAQNVAIITEPEPYHLWAWEDFEIDNPVGQMMGTFATISNDEASERGIYVLQSDGRFRRIRNDEENYRKAYLPTFRACFVPTEPLAKNSLTVTYADIEQGGGDHIDQLIAFPTTDFVGDADFFSYDDENETGIILRPQEGDGGHRYFDLQGRQLKSRPQKGVYIDNGKKVIK